MKCFIYFLVAVVSYQGSAAVVDREVYGTELEFAFMTHRHGDRTPVQQMMPLINASQDLLQLIDSYGYGQLTKPGRQTGFKLGQFIRGRYNQLLSPKFNRSEIFIRSTDSTRTKMTVLSAMAAVYFTNGTDNWSRNIHWDPVPYTTVPAKYDFNLANINCPVFSSFYGNLTYKQSPRMAKYSNVLTKVSNIFGIDLLQAPIMAFGIYDLLVSMQHLDYPIGYDLEQLMPELRLAANEAVDIELGDERYIALQAGVLLNEFFEYANQIINGTDTPRVRVYSAHDFNVYSFEAVSRVFPRQGAPKYGSLLSLELRRVVKTGEYVVLPVYLPTPDETEVYLSVEGCGFPCNYEKFYQITSKYQLDVNTWRDQCGFTEDLAIDSSSID